MIGKIFSLGGAKLKLIALLVLAVLVMLVVIQSYRLNHYRDTSSQLIDQIDQLNRGAALTERLHRDNAEIDLESSYRLRELENAEDVDIGLPQSLIDLLERVRR